MSFLDKIADSFRNNQEREDEEYFLDDDYYDEDEGYEDEPKGGLFRNRASADNGSEQRSGGFFGNRNKTVSVVPTAMQVTMKRPKSINDSKDICDDLLDGRAVVINLEGVNSDIAQRIIDFTFGAVYSIDGDLKSISKYTFIASPHSVELSGDFREFGDMDSSRSSAYYGGQRQTRSAGFAFNG